MAKRKSKSSGYLVHFAGRNTGKAVRAKSRSEAIAKARKSKTAGYKGKVVAARKLTGKALKDSRNGRWIRIRANQSMNATKPKGGSFKFRKGLKKRATRVLPKSRRK